MRATLVLACLPVLLCTALHAEHGSVGAVGEAGETKAPNVGDTIYRAAPSGDLPPVPPAVVVAAPSGGRAAPDKQLFLIEVGLERDERAFRAADVALAVRLAKLFEERFVGSRVQIHAPVDRGKLETAALAAEGFRRALVIFLGPTPTDRWGVRSEKGWLDDKTIAETLNRLAVRLHLPVKKASSPLDILKGPAVHVALLTALAGAVDCGPFPGPVFGLASRRGLFPHGFVEEWLQEIERNATLLLPAVAPQWFEVFRYRDRGRVGAQKEAWLCPADAPGGYRGAKMRSD